MIAKMQIKIRDRTGKEIVYNPGDILKKINPKEAERLLKIGAAEGIIEPNELDAIELLTEAELKKIPSKQKLIEYAESIGLYSLNQDQLKDELVSEIVLYIQQNQDERYLG